MSRVLDSICVLIACLAVCWLPAVTGYFFRPGEWYALLEKPLLTPPGIVFAIVWPILYTLLGIALWRVIVADGPGRERFFRLFTIQLLLNALWTPTFFGAHLMEAGLFILVPMIVATGFAAHEARKFSEIAYRCMMPYILWLLFATYLNATLVVLN